MSAPDTTTDPELDAVAWDLAPLLDDGSDPVAAVDAMLAAAQARADAFAATHAGKVDELDGPGLVALMRELGELQELAGRAGSYAVLNFSGDTADPARGALLQRMQEKATAIETALLFFELEWAALDDARADELLAADGLDFARHHLRSARRYRPHLLSEPEERILAEQRADRPHAPGRGCSRSRPSAITVDLPDATEPASLEVAMSRLFSPDRDVRRDTAAARHRAPCEPGLRTRALRLQHAAGRQDGRRPAAPLPALAGEPQPRQRGLRRVRRRRSIDAVRARYEVPRRWYRLKAQLLGLDRLADYDRMAPVTDDDEQVGWSEARELVLDSYGSFSGELGDLARRFFDERWIDAPVRPGKRGGAFCAYTVPSAHPYVLLNYTSRRRDVLTLAHELGHGVHAALGGRQGVFHMSTPLTLAETASVFGETDRLRAPARARRDARVAALAADREHRRRRSRPCSARSP